MKWDNSVEQPTRVLAVVQGNAPLGTNAANLTEQRHEIVFLADGVNRAVPWTQPVDSSFEEATELLTHRPNEQGFWKHGFFWSIAHGHLIGVLGHGSSWVTPQNAREVMEIASLSEQAPDKQDTIIKRLSYQRWSVMHYGNMVRLAVFLVVALWPIRWARQACRNEPGETTVQRQAQSEDFSIS